MNSEFLKSIGIDDTDPEIVLGELGTREIELLDKRDLAETNGAGDRVKEIDAILEQLKTERERIKEEAKTAACKPEEPVNTRQRTGEQAEKKKEAYEKLMQKKKAQAKMQAEAQNGSQAEPQIGSQTEPQNGTQTEAQTVSQTKPQTGTQNGTQKTAKVIAAASASGTGQYAAGLRHYQKQEFDQAFQCFLSVAEEKDPADKNAEQERTRASYLLGIMYINGTGTTQDSDRGSHYLKRAADFGYDQAQFEYGVYELSQHMTSSGEDLKVRRAALEYIEKAADAGLTDALKKYIDFAIHSDDAGKDVRGKAKAYIPVLKSKTDSYEARQYDDFVAALDKKEKEVKKKASRSRIYIVGEIIILIGMVYLLKGLNPKLFSDMIPIAGRLVPDIPDSFILKWDKLTAMTDPYMTVQGIFGCWVIIFGNMIRGLGVKEAVLGRGAAAGCKRFRTVARILFLALCIAHFAANIAETSHFWGNGGFLQVAVLIVAILTGRMAGGILRKILK